MSIRVALHHQSHYRFDRPVVAAPHEIRLRPAAHARTPIAAYSLRVRPEGHFIHWQQDAYGNFVARLTFPEPTRELDIVVDLVADMTVINPFDFFVEDWAERYPFVYPPRLASELTPFLETDPPGPRLAAWLADFRRDLPADLGIANLLVRINQRVHECVRYLIRLEPGVQDGEETLEKGSGSCRDSAWLLAQLLRHLGIASRFVSGYLIQLAADEKPLDGPAGPESDFTDLHAWCEAYIPGAGWVGMDATSGLLAGEGHIPLAVSALPTSAAPVIGMTSVCESTLDVTMRVTRIHEDPRVTRPYTDEQWQAIRALGRKIDADLAAGDVRLTQGGEPTFVSIDDMDGAEWNTDALGEEKWRLANRLFGRLHDRFAPGGVAHYGQGKWYPGEPLPRWSLNLFWRADGVPVWRDLALLADEADASRTDEAAASRTDEATADKPTAAPEPSGALAATAPNADIQAAGGDEPPPSPAETLGRALTRRLGLHPDYLIPAFEDPWRALDEESRLPANLDPHDADLTRPGSRQTLARRLRAGLASVTGYVLPLKALETQAKGDKGNKGGGKHDKGDKDGGQNGGKDGKGARDTADASRIRWTSSRWPLRHERLYLLPGDSPLGLRLPLNSLPWVAPEDFELELPPDPFAETSPLPDPALSLAPAAADAAHPDADDPAAAEEAPEPRAVIHTALALEIRDGLLHVFLPPLTRLEAWLTLLAAIESCAAELGQRLRLEGYPPPRDPRLRALSVTPDPGVIEVNIHPADTWDELEERTRVLYAEARQSRLGTEKFMLDGRHTGTGGGHHITLGGATPADSPFLRRPDLLQSLLTWWQRHPSLSYLFSGQFIGPTSQAPRVDEARDDNLYELEIAFQRMSQAIASGKESERPWLVDRLLRNLLIDMTGNTHRAEFCIDKLYSPDSATGRLGLVEFRAFEMPPHYRMSLLQALLLRALVARFWKTPYTEPLVYWDTALHDRFMLPHFIAADLRDVARDLRAAGYACEDAWFDPFLEFRFPHHGTVVYDGIRIELRQAIEPWHVLGEEIGAGGTARYVDSSVERLQVRVSGMTGDRHRVVCNGRPLPLHPTGVPGEAVAGVRFKAWAPHSALHPTIGVHSPLVFDLLDRWNGRSLGGCTYHVVHPGGRNYETFPVNANEAEARRRARFWDHGHTPGPMRVADEPANPRFPMTLDLRWRPG